MGKKLLIGCLVLGVVGVIAAGIAGYYFLYRPARDYLAGLAEVSQVVELNDEVANQAPYTPPADNLLTEAQVTAFVAVQRKMVRDLGAALDELRTKYEAYGEGDRPGLGELLGAWRELKDLVLQAKRIQVEALNEAGLSVEEYRWVRARFYQALGAEFFSLNLEKIAEAVQQQNPDLLQETSPPDLAPEENRRLVEPYQDEAAEWLAYAWLGL